jgi:hypothetical protein
VRDRDAFEEILRPGQQSWLRQPAARPCEQIGRCPPLLDQHDLLAFVLIETTGELHVDETRLHTQLGELGSEQIIERPNVLARDASSQDADDHRASIVGGHPPRLQRV